MGLVASLCIGVVANAGEGTVIVRGLSALRYMGKFFAARCGLLPRESDRRERLGPSLRENLTVPSVD